MSKKERTWRRFYLFAMIFIYGIFGPVEIIEFILGEGSFPLTFIVVGIALPLIRKNHLDKILLQEAKQDSSG